MMMDKLFSKGPVFMCFGGGGGDSGGGGGGNDNDSGGGSNSFTETLANIFTPNDGASYVGGQLVDDNTGSSIAAGGTTSTGNVVSGRANTASNDRDDPTPVVAAQPATVATTATSNLGALPASLAARPASTEGVENSVRENLANLITPGDGAKYVNGQLINTTTGESLTGGGYATNAAGMEDYIYGVSDDFSNNAPLERGNMSNQDYAGALQKFKIRQSQLENIPPSDPAYFSSFIPGQTIPLVGGYLGKKMLEGGINDRRAMMDQHQAALNAGAKADMSDGVYRGYTGVDGAFVPYIENKNQDPLTDSNFGALNIGNNRTDDRSDPVVLPPETGMGGGETVPLATLTQPERMQSYEPIPMDPNTIVYASPMYEKFQFEVLPGILKQMPNMTQEDIDAAFILYRDRQKAAE